MTGSKKKVIILVGKARSGKDTAARMIEDWYSTRGKRTLIVHYADALKHVCENYYGWDGEKDEHGRTLLQTVGERVRNTRSESYWVDFLTDMLWVSQNEWDVAVIADGRRENEVYLNSPFKVLSIRIIRPPAVLDTLTEEQKNHVSETELETIKTDYMLFNNGGFGDLRKKIDRILPEIEEDAQNV